MSLPPLRAPREHGSLFAEPALDQVWPLLRQNHALLSSAPIALLGRPLPHLRQLARAEAISAARAYLAEAGEPLPAAEEKDLWLIAGHQPELFHPGVWVKNFALHGLARRHGAFSLNLVVDNDTAKATTLRLPAGDHVIRLPFDHWHAAAPYEERPVLDEGLFASLPQRAREITGHWPFTPLLPDFWAEVLRRERRTPLLGERLVAARRTFERRWGCHQLELPLSRLCRSEAFAWFAGHLLAELPRLHDVYNGAVQDYRRRHGLRSQNHPVPDLAREGDWYEAPLWAWRPGQARRGRLFARLTARTLQLRSGDDVWPTLLAPAEPEAFVSAWRSLEAQGCKVRTRALTTTLFARLCLGDMFVHGIGGGKYDELTDALLQRFFGLSAAPAYMVLSATLLLPLHGYPASAEACRRLAQSARDTWYNPQRHFPDGHAPGAADLLRQKQAWIEHVGRTHEERRERFRAIRRLNEQLRAFLDGTEEKLRLSALECRARLQVNEVQGRRDYAFCLYPEEMLRPFYESLMTSCSAPGSRLSLESANLST